MHKDAPFESFHDITANEVLNVIDAVNNDYSVSIDSTRYDQTELSQELQATLDRDEPLENRAVSVRLKANWAVNHRDMPTQIAGWEVIVDYVDTRDTASNVPLQRALQIFTDACTQERPMVVRASEFADSVGTVRESNRLSIAAGIGAYFTWFAEKRETTVTPSDRADFFENAPDEAVNAVVRHAVDEGLDKGRAWMVKPLIVHSDSVSEIRPSPPTP